MLMQTTIEIDDDLLGEARKYSHAQNTGTLVQEALMTFVAVKAAERRRVTYRERLEQVRNAVSGVGLPVDSRYLVRTDRDSQ
jgi:Arc/MetJ family transcription regulator